MSISFYPEIGGQPLIEISVDSPGHGYLWVRDLRPGEENRIVDLAGPQLGEILSSLTQMAFSDVASCMRKVARLGLFSVYEIRAMLPAFQRAVIYACTRSEFAERILDQPASDERPREVVCVDCGEGHVYSSDEGRTSVHCAEHGHHPFGRDTTWARAQESYQRDVEWFQIMHRPSVASS